MDLDSKYQEQLIELHKNDKTFNAGRKKLSTVLPFIDQYNPTTLLDIGCGKGGLIKAISEERNIKTTGYDPGVPEYINWPDEVFDVVISTDALEHVEPDQLADTLQSIDLKFKQSAFFIIACYPAKKFLPDGRNAHLIIETPEWWRQQLLTNMTIKIVSETIKIRHFTPKKIPAFSGAEYTIVLEKRPVKWF